MTGARVLIVDDDPAILRSVRRALDARGYDVEVSAVVSGIHELVAKFRPDVILLDLLLPDGDGIEIAHELKGSSRATVIVLSAVGDESRKVAALDAGAQDYVTKPFGMEELLARVRVALRRSAGAATTQLTAGPIHIDLETRVVQVGKHPIRLTPTEFDLLRMLVEQQGRVLTQRMILGTVWGAGYASENHVLRTFVHQVRQKLNAAEPGSGDLIENDPGVGYRLAVSE